MATVPLGTARLSSIARTILSKRYLVKDEQGQPIEEPETMFWRVAQTIADADARYGASADEIEQTAQMFYDLMTQGLFEPNSPTLMNAGRPLGQLSACFVLPVPDDLAGIYETLKHQALIHQSGGGTGFAFSRLRQRNDTVRSTMGVASGPVSFMKVYDHSTEAVKQGGTRRGANMGILRVDHPDIIEFITCKNDTTQITNFNISVAITDAFMVAVERDEEYDLVNPRTRQIAGQLRAREVFDKIIDGAWRTGEPGVFFIDRANEYNPVPHLGAYEATNPCGEQPLLPYDVCNLGSINLGAFVDERQLDWARLREAVHQCTHFLDNVIDANKFPLPEITDLAQRIRRIGLGVMGWADLLIKLDIPYMSEEAVELGRTVMEFVDEESKRASEQLAEKRGVFREWERSIWGPDATCARRPNGERIRPERRLRNCNVTTVAPTGTISMIADCSSGIEPIFAVAFMRNQAGALMPDVNKFFVERAQAEGWYSEELMRRIAEQGHIHFPQVPEVVQRAFQTAHDITPEWHVRMQAAFQEYTDSAISKTTNFPHGATPDDVRQIYELAFKLGCKGVTVYRDGSRDNQVLSTGATGKQEAPAAAATATGNSDQGALPTGEPQAVHEMNGHSSNTSELQTVHEMNGHSSNGSDVAATAEGGNRTNARANPGTVRPKPLPRGGLPACRFEVDTPLGSLNLFVTEQDGLPFEVFAIIGRAGSDTAAFTEAIGRLLSIALRSGVPVDELARQLRGIGGARSWGFGPSRVRSVPDAIGKVLQEHYVTGHGIADITAEAQQQELPLSVPVARGEICPSCGNATLMQVEGCAKCAGCGHSEC